MKVFLHLNEATYSGDLQTNGVLKGLTTDKQYTLRKLYQDAKKLESFINMCYSSNNMQAYNCKRGQRRGVVTETDNRLAGIVTPEKKKYIDAIVNVDNSCFLKVLLRRDLSKFEARSFPRTKAMFEQMDFSMNTVQKFILDLIRGNEGGGSHAANCVISLTEANNQPNRRTNDSVFGENTNNFVDREKLYAEYLKQYGGRIAERAAVGKSMFWIQIRSTKGEDGCGLKVPLEIKDKQVRENNYSPNYQFEGRNYEPEVESKIVKCSLFPTREEAIQSFENLADDGYKVLWRSL
jgi:hypothetical protein